MSGSRGVPMDTRGVGKASEAKGDREGQGNAVDHILMESLESEVMVLRKRTANLEERLMRDWTQGPPPVTMVKEHGARRHEAGLLSASPAASPGVVETQGPVTRDALASTPPGPPPAEREIVLRRMALPGQPEDACGVGLQFQVDHDTDAMGSLAVEDVRWGSAAALDASIKPGDTISRINGTALAGLKASEVIDLIRGPAGSEALPLAKSV
ncbi:hypothetical protein T484DRAFT_1806629 [Baffinella frigidus]|nr:hypothetical protein T484DRAFT_1806629 [Cryptophyta sp. CCMP2293]